VTTLAIVLKCGSLNLLEPSGPVKACNGIALPLLFSEAVPPVVRAAFCIISGDNNDRLFIESLNS
jgi:hypothetical protein